MASGSFFSLQNTIIKHLSTNENIASTPPPPKKIERFSANVHIPRLLSQIPNIKHDTSRSSKHNSNKRRQIFWMRLFQKHLKVHSSLNHLIVNLILSFRAYKVKRHSFHATRKQKCRRLPHFADGASQQIPTLCDKRF